MDKRAISLCPLCDHCPEVVIDGDEVQCRGCESASIGATMRFRGIALLVGPYMTRDFASPTLPAGFQMVRSN
jgi:hypothetical protein